MIKPATSAHTIAAAEAYGPLEIFIGEVDAAVQTEALVVADTGTLAHAKLRGEDLASDEEEDSAQAITAVASASAEVVAMRPPMEPAEKLADMRTAEKPARKRGKGTGATAHQSKGAADGRSSAALDVIVDDDVAADHGKSPDVGRCTDTIVEELIARARKVLQSKVPRRHADYRPLRADLEKITSVTPQRSDVHGIARALLNRLNE